MTKYLKDFLKKWGVGGGGVEGAGREKDNAQFTDYNDENKSWEQEHKLI